MKRIGIVVAVAVVVAVGWFASKDWKEKPEKEEKPVAERPVADQALLDAVLESPEVLDGKILEVRRPPKGNEVLISAVPVCTVPTGKDRQLLSDIEKPPAPQPLKEPVAVDSLQFRKDYASLRTDAIRNPNSPENRAGVVSLMKARQRRLGQK